MNYRDVAQKIFDQVGDHNVEQIRHCTTRLRLKVINPDLVNDEEINKITEVQKVVKRGNDIQVVIGNEIDEVYEEFVKIAGNLSSSNNDQTEKTEKNSQNLFSRFVNTISECISPILPALVACGLSSALASLIRATGIIDIESTTFQIISAFGSAPMYFLPFFLAVSSAKRLNVNPYLSMVVAALIMYPNLTAIIGGEVQADFFGIPVINVTYSQSLIPILLAVWLQTYIEPFLTKVLPKSVRSMLLPFLTFIVIGTVTLLVLGPIAAVITDGISAVLTPLSENYAWAAVALIGCLNVFMVGAGVHHGILPIAVTNFAMFGYDNIIGPAMFVTTFGLGGACLAYALKTKSQEMRQVAISSGITSLMGITEPGIYSVLFVNKKSLISCMIAGLVGGTFMGLCGVRVWALGPKGITGFALLAGPEFALGVAGCAISFVVAFVASYILGEDKKETV